MNLKRRRKKTWIVVLDGGAARIYRDPGAKAALEPIFESEADPRRSRDLETDRPGRVHDRTTHRRAAMDPQEDAQRREKFRFVRAVAERIDRASHDGDFDRLVLIAPPQALGDLRSVLGPRSRDAVVAEVPKDLIRASISELETQVAAALQL
jgi:protein required for attachment to host cells